MSGSEMLHGNKTRALQQEGCTSLTANWASNITCRLPVPTSMGGGLGGQLLRPTLLPVHVQGSPWSCRTVLPRAPTVRQGHATHSGQ